MFPGTRLSGTHWPGCPGGMKYKDRWLGGDLPGGNVLDPWQVEPKIPNRKKKRKNQE